MGVSQRTPEEQIEAYLQQQIRQREKALLNAFSYVAKACIKEARENGSYIDRTGNLRSSIGYVILRDGVVMSQSDFTQVRGQGDNMYLVDFKTSKGERVKYWTKGQSGDGSQGSEKGKAFIQNLVAEYRKGLFLIVVAGMEYAAAVEAKNFNVLTSAELTAKQMVPQILSKLGF